MRCKIFIQSNNKQLLGARLAAFAAERFFRQDHTIPVEILNIDTPEIRSLFKTIADQEYVRKGKVYTYRMNDLQSFTLTRFLPPERMGFEGKALVIDPDIFARVDLHELFALDMRGSAIAACRKNDAWDTSVMLLDCARLTHWRMKDITKQLLDKTLDYDDLSTLRKETSVYEIPRLWNNLDHLDETTKLLHTTQRLTQPWKTGLSIDFTRYPMKKIAGIIPREWAHRLLGRYPDTYQPHPDKNIERFFFSLVGEAKKAGVITDTDIQSEIDKKNIRADFFSVLASYSQV